MCTLADVALGYNIAFAQEKPVPAVTANLNIDFLSSTNLGDWLEVHVEVKKIGRKLAFAKCDFVVKGKTVAIASGVFSVHV